MRTRFDRLVIPSLGALVAAPAVALLWASRRWPLIHDAPIMQYIAWRITQGAVPYRDLFDMNQPGTYVLHVAVLRVFGESDLGWRLFDLSVLATIAALIAAIARPWGRLASFGGAFFFALYHVSGGAWQAGQRDLVLCPFLLGAALLAIAWIEHAPAASAWWMAASGLVLGAGVTIKPHAAVFGAMLVVAAALAAWRRSAHVLRTTIAFVAGAVVCPLAVLGWLAARGALGAWWTIVSGYLVPLYSKLGRPSHWTVYRGQIWIPIAATVVLSTVSALGHRRFGARHAVVLAGIAYGLVHFFGQGKGWEYHLYPLAAFVSVLVFSEVEAVVLDRRVLVGVPLVAALVAAVVMVTAKGVEASDAAWIRDKEHTVRLLTADLSTSMRPGDTVQVLDTTGGGIHALLRLHAREPTRFIYDFHFFHDTDAPFIVGLRDELIRDLTRRPPRFVVVFEQGWPSGGYERIDTFPRLARLLARAYTVVRERPGYRILAKRHDP